MTSSPTPAIEIDLEPEASADDTALMTSLADLINSVYVIAEAGLWVDGARRTDAREVAELVAQQELAVARIADEVVGVVRVHGLDAGTAEFGMLAADPGHRGVGVGTALVAFAERWAGVRGFPRLQLELLVPTSWEHPSKRFLAEWYGRIGFHEVRRGPLAELYPELEPLLATPCVLVVSQKSLAVGGP